MKTGSSLTKYPQGSLRELLALAASLTLILASNGLMGFVDRILLAQHSLESLQICVAAASLTTVFQMFCVRIAHVSQIFIGQYKGANRPELIGPCVWQSIWFSFLSMIVTLPVSWIVGPRFFAGTSVAEPGLAYFRILMCANFLFPLGASLFSFYLGRGRMNVVIISAFIGFLLNIAIDVALIFGIRGFWGPMGAMGSAIAVIVTQAVLCIVLFIDFLKKEHRQTYGIHFWQFDWSLLKQTLKVAVPRSATSFILLSTWAACVQIMMRKGGDYMAVITFGSSIFLLTDILAQGLAQAMMTSGAYTIGTKNWSCLRNTVRSGYLAALLLGTILAIPLVCFPQFPIAVFFKGEISSSLRQLLNLSCACLWVNVLAQALSSIGSGVLLASRDALFLMMFHLAIGWGIIYFPPYIGIEVLGWPPYAFFLCAALSCIIVSVAYYLRFSQERWKCFELVETSS